MFAQFCPAAQRLESIALTRESLQLSTAKHWDRRTIIPSLLLGLPTGEKAAKFHNC